MQVSEFNDHISPIKTVRGIKKIFYYYSVYIYIYIYIYIQESLNKFPDFFRIGTFIDSTHMKL